MTHSLFNLISFAVLAVVNFFIFFKQKKKAMLYCGIAFLCFALSAWPISLSPWKMVGAVEVIFSLLVFYESFQSKQKFLIAVGGVLLGSGIERIIFG